MAHEVRTPVFEGPLDLLLELTARHQVDVMEVRLEEIVDGYLAAVEAMATVDLDGMSEFVLVAATLLQLKTRLLLPSDRELELDEDLALLSERDVMLQRLLACATFKDVAAVLAYRMEQAGRWIPRMVGIDQELHLTVPLVRLEAGPAELAVRAASLLAEKDVDTEHLDLELPSVGDAMDDVRRRFATVFETTFTELVEHCSRPVEVVAYFLAVLELARWGTIHLAQDEWLAEIQVRRPL